MRCARNSQYNGRNKETWRFGKGYLNLTNWPILQRIARIPPIFLIVTVLDLDPKNVFENNSVGYIIKKFARESLI